MTRTRVRCSITWAVACRTTSTSHIRRSSSRTANTSPGSGAPPRSGTDEPAGSRPLPRTIQGPMTRFQKLSLGALVAVYVMVCIGAAVRGTGSGMGCPDWPLCNGRIVPQLGDTQAWVEWIHRGWGVLVGFIALAVVIAAWRTHRHTRSIVIGSIVGLLMPGFSA